MLSLTLLLLVQAPAPAQVLQHALAAVEGDSVAQVRARWEGILERTPNDRSALLGLASLDRLTYRYAGAEERLARLTGDDDWALYAKLERAHGDLWRRPFSETIYLYLDVAARARARHDSTLASTALAVSGFLGSRLGVLAASLDTLEAAFKLAPQQARMLRGRIRCTAGPILSFAGRPGAMAAVHEGLELVRPTGDRRAMGLCYHAAAMVAVNDLDDAAVPEIYTDSAIAVQRASNDGPMMALSWYTKGYSRYTYSDFAGAKRAFADAVVGSEQYDNPFVLAWSRRFLSMLYWTAGDIPASVQDFQEAESLFMALNDGFGISHVRNGRAIALLSIGRIGEAESTFRAQLALSERNGMAEGVFANLQNLSAVRASQGDWRGAMNELDRAIAYGNANGHAGWTASLDYRRGVIAMRLGDLDAAERYLRRVSTIIGPEQFLDRYAVQTRLAEIAARRGRLDSAVAGLRSASRQLDSMRHSLNDEQLRLLVFQTRSATDEPDLGLAPIATLLVRGGRVEPAFMLAEQRRARTLDEQLVKSALLRGDSVNAVTALHQPDDLPTLQRRLPAGLAVISYLTGGGTAGTSAFVLTRDTLLGVVLPPLDSLSGDIDRYVTLMRQNESTAGLEQRLAMALLHPVIALLPAGVDRVVLIPDDQLHRVPFDALPFPDGEPFLARYAISRAPSLAVLLRLAQRPRREGTASILALGDPTTGQADSGAVEDPVTERYRRAFAEVGGLPPLEASRAEARRVGSHGRNNTVRLGKRASEAFLKQASLNQFRVVHLASHAVVDDLSESRTSLALAPGDGEDGFLGASELGALQLHADLVVLSACRTAAGRVIGGEGLQGLVAPLLGAGARTIVASGWSVGDRRTAELMRDFYDELAEGQPVGAALRSAKLKARDRGEPAAVWAAFTLVGDPDVMIPLERRRSSALIWYGAAAVLVMVLMIRRLRAESA